MMDFNLVVLTGRLVADPGVKYSVAGLPIGSFGVAVNGMKPKGGGDAPVSFFNVTVFGKPAEWLIGAFHKGSKITLKGRLTQDRWDDKDTGAKRSMVKIIADQIDWPPKPKGQDVAGEESQEYPAETAQAHPAEESQGDEKYLSELDDDEISF